MAAKLPVWRTAVDCYRVTFRHLGDLLRFGWPWFLALVVVSGALYWSLYPLEMAAKDSGGTNVLWLSTLVASTTIGALIAVPWHRMLLLGEPQKSRDAFPFGSRQWAYLGRALTLIVVPILPLWAISILFPDQGDNKDGAFTLHDAFVVLTFALWVTGFLVLNRLSLVLPATALDAADTSWSTAWRLTSGNTWRFFWSSFALVIPIIVAAIVWMISPANIDNLGQISLNHGAERLSFTLWSIAYELVAMLLGMLFVTFLSLAYRHFRGLPEPGGAAATAAAH